MITTLTPNPSIDRTLTVDRLEIGSVIRVASTMDEAAGKGINVARSIASQGRPARAVFPAGGANGSAFEEMVKDIDGLDVCVVAISGPVRTNITIADSVGVTTKLNEAGPTVGSADQERLLAEVNRAAATSTWVVACGSLPPGIASDFYARVAERMRQTSTRLAVDTSGAALDAMVGVQCALLKPNRSELASISAQPVTTLGEVVSAAQVLRSKGADAVLVSLGADGALLVDAEGALHGVAPTATIVNTVGAGDALLAGFLLGGDDRSEALTSALAWGRSTVASLSTLAPPSAEDLAAVTVFDTIDDARRLEDDS